MRVFAVVEYVGTNYFGWQKQAKEITIQGQIEGILSKILNTNIIIHGSGRTDAGVHAHGQTFHFDIEKEDVDINQLKYSVNCLLPKDIHIKHMEVAQEDFHARISAKSKLYQYEIHLGKISVFYYPYVEEILCPFDTKKFEQALDMFVGTHDFRNFTSKEDEEGFSFERTIYSIVVDKCNKHLIINLHGTGFMRYMIRFIIGTAIAYARGQIELDYITSRLDSETREISAYKASAKGLVLKEVVY